MVASNGERATTLGAYSGPQQIMNLYDSLPPYSSLFFFRVPNENTHGHVPNGKENSLHYPSWSLCPLWLILSISCCLQTQLNHQRYPCCASLLYTFALFFHVSTTNIFLHTNSISTNELLSGLESNSFID